MFNEKRTLVFALEENATPAFCESLMSIMSLLISTQKLYKRVQIFVIVYWGRSQARTDKQLNNGEKDYRI